MATLKLKNVNKIYPNNVQAVFDFNIEVKDKEFIVFVGPSGCGKSTTLRMIAGLENITSGEFYIDDKLMNLVEPKDRNIAMVFQSYALYPHMTVYGNMEFALKLRKVKKPLYEENEEVNLVREENKNIMKQIKALDAKFKKSQNNNELLEPRKALYDQIYANEEKILSLSKPVIGRDEETIETNKKIIEKLKKEIVKSEKLIAKYEGKDEQGVQSLKDYNVAREAQIADYEKRNKYLEENDVELEKLRHLTKYERNLEINKVAESIDLTRYLFRKPAALSGGQRQRVALGRAIVRKPKVFLMDEPLSNLDAKLRVQTRSEIARIHQAVGATTIYVTHDQTEALTLADRIVIMKDGHIQQIGTPVEVYEDPANKFVGGFIGSPSMNFIKGVVNKKGMFIANGADGKSSIAFTLGAKDIRILKDYIDKEVILGVRPEDIYPLIDGVKNKTLSDTISLKVDFTELLGKERVVYMNDGVNKVVYKTLEKVDAVRGKETDVKFDVSRLYFFDAETELRIR